MEKQDSRACASFIPVARRQRQRTPWRLALALSSITFVLLSFGFASGAEPFIYFVSIPPQAYFLQSIGGDQVSVRVMVAPGQSPHTFEPTARQLADLSEARAYFAIGVAFEKSLLARIRRSFKTVQIVDSRKGIQPRAMEDDREGRGVQQPGARVDEGGMDPHVWLSPRQSIMIAGNICGALAVFDPAHEAMYRENFESLQKSLIDLDAAIRGLLAPYRGREILVFHPAYGYYADDYGLVQVAIEESGGAPGPRHLAEVIERAKAHGIRTVFVQQQISETYARAVADAIGGEIVIVDPLARDYPGNLMDITRKIVHSFE